jgi:1,4-alpha-glucan branching enzyme
MLDVQIGATCKACGKPITQAGRGPRKREYCSNACRERAYRERKGAQPTLELQNIAVYQEKLTQAGAHIQKLERQVEVQKSRIGELTADNRRLAAQLENIQLANERFRTDTQERAFPTWLEKDARYYAKSAFGRRFLADRNVRLLPVRASRANYERIMRYTLKYTEDEIETFREAWHEMLKTQF